MLASPDQQISLTDPDSRSITDIAAIRRTANNDDHPLMMTPPVIPPTEDVRWTVRAIAKALDKSALEIVGDEVRPEDGTCGRASRIRSASVDRCRRSRLRSSNYRT
jgi:hypothetical protein